MAPASADAESADPRGGRVPGSIVTCDALVVGAGVSGLAAARELTRRGQRVIVLERAKGVGGRCASRTLGGQRVDYGVAYLHGSHPHFLGDLEALGPDTESAGLVHGWPRRVVNPRLACQPDSFTQNQRRFGVVAGVSAFPQALAAGLDVRIRRAVQWLAPAQGAIDALLADGSRFRAPRVVLAMAAPQALRLIEPLAPRLGGGEGVLDRLGALDHVPCLTVVAGYPISSPAPAFDLAHPLETTILRSLAHESTKRPKATERVLVLQARERYSSEHLDRDAEVWVRDMVWEAGEMLGEWAGQPLWTYPHRWTWARLRQGSSAGGPAPWLEAEGGGFLGLCGEAFSPPGGVEGAFLSGIELARTSPPGR